MCIGGCYPVRNYMMKINYLLQLPENIINNTKVHFAIGIPNREAPLVELYDGKFQEWQEWQTKKNFERDYILSLVYYKPGEWVYAGIFQSLSVEYNDDFQCYKYSTKLTSLHDECIGRLIVSYKKEFRQTYVYLENYLNDIDVIEYLRDKVSILPFSGYDKVNLNYNELSLIINNNIESWKTALSSVKGIYIITDKSNGKHYIGAAYGEKSFWQRWSEYVYTKHGFNEGLKKVLNVKGEEYASNFTFSILEIKSCNEDSNEILRRETFWKDTLCTRIFGYNEN